MHKTHLVDPRAVLSGDHGGSFAIAPADSLADWNQNGYLAPVGFTRNLGFTILPNPKLQWLEWSRRNLPPERHATLIQGCPFDPRFLAIQQTASFNRINSIVGHIGLSSP